MKVLKEGRNDDWKPSENAGWGTVFHDEGRDLDIKIGYVFIFCGYNRESCSSLGVEQITFPAAGVAKWGISTYADMYKEFTQGEQRKATEFTHNPSLILVGVTINALGKLFMDTSLC